MANGALNRWRRNPKRIPVLKVKKMPEVQVSKQHKQLFLTFLGGIRVVVSTSSFLFDMPIGPETRKNNGEMDLMGCFFLDSFYPKTIGKTERWNAEISQQFSASAQPLGEKKLRRTAVSVILFCATKKWYLGEGFFPSFRAPCLFPHIPTLKGKLPEIIIDSKKHGLFLGGLFGAPGGWLCGSFPTVSVVSPKQIQ